MCRFLAYKGDPVIMDRLLYQPENSLIHQSYHALERRDPVNGDGDGIGWYVPEISPDPAVFLSVLPAWHNKNLRNISSKIKSDCIFAHVRAAGDNNITENNCHPFSYQRFLMMHNGQIASFSTIKREICNSISNHFYNWIKGETDSEHFFSIFLNKLYSNKQEDHTDVDIVNALQEAITELNKILNKHNITDPTYLNCAITDGKCIVATKYVSDLKLEAATLYRSASSNQRICKYLDIDYCKTQALPLFGDGVLVVSEKLTENKEDWHKIPKNHFVVVSKDLSVYEKQIV